MWSQLSILLSLLLSASSVSDGLSSCMLDTLRCARERIPFSTYKKLAETPRELYQICRSQLRFFSCLEEVSLHENVKEMGGLPGQLPYARLLLKELCRENSVWQSKYLLLATCINEQNTDYCVSEAFLSSPDDKSDNSSCSALVKAMDCISNTLASGCDIEASNLFNFLFRIATDGEPVCGNYADYVLLKKQSSFAHSNNKEFDEQSEPSDAYISLLKRIGELDELECTEGECVEPQAKLEKLETLIGIKKTKDKWHYNLHAANRVGDLSMDDSYTEVSEFMASSEKPEVIGIPTLDYYGEEYPETSNYGKGVSFNYETTNLYVDETLNDVTDDHYETSVYPGADYEEVAESDTEYPPADSMQYKDMFSEYSKPETFPGVEKIESEKVTFEDVRVQIENRLSRVKSNTAILRVLGVHNGVEVRNFPDGSIALYWREMADTPYENMTCHWHDECKVSASFQCILEPRVTEPACPSIPTDTSVDLDEVDPELIDPELGGKFIEKIRTEGDAIAETVTEGDAIAETVTEGDAIAETVTEGDAIAETVTEGDAIAETVTDSVFRARRGIVFPTSKDFVRSEHFNADFLTGVSDNDRTDPKQIKTVTYYYNDSPDTEEALKASYFSNGRIIMSFTQKIFKPMQKTVCFRVNECHPAAFRVFKCVMIPKTDPHCSEFDGTRGNEQGQTDGEDTLENRDITSDTSREDIVETSVGGDLKTPSFETENIFAGKEIELNGAAVITSSLSEPYTTEGFRSEFVHSESVGPSILKSLNPHVDERISVDKTVFKTEVISEYTDSHATEYATSTENIFRSTEL